MQRCPREKYRICGSQLVWSAANSCRKMMGVPASGFLEIEADFVAGDGIGHLTFLLIGPVSKIAVNTRGCNEAKSIPFPPSNTRGMTPKPIGHRHMKSCSRHAATRNTQTLRPSRTGRGLGV